jgi:hypothetical protein
VAFFKGAVLSLYPVTCFGGVFFQQKELFTEQSGDTADQCKNNIEQNAKDQLCHEEAQHHRKGHPPLLERLQHIGQYQAEKEKRRRKDDEYGISILTLPPKRTRQYAEYDAESYAEIPEVSFFTFDISYLF